VAVYFLEMEWSTLLSSFILLAMAEVGDKTQLALVTLSVRGSRRSVFLGALLAFILLDLIGVSIGGALGNVLPLTLVAFFSSSIFIIYGLYGLIVGRRSEVKSEGKCPPSLLYTFLTVTLMEMGDKTQLMTIALSARYSELPMVFLGVATAFIVVTGISVLAGKTISKLIPRNYVDLFTSVLFILFGLFIIAQEVL